MSIPADLTAEVAELLTAHPGAVSLSVSEGASVIPSGDVVTVTILRESASNILSSLRALGVHEVGTLTVITPELDLSKAGDLAEQVVPGSPVDSIVWDEVRRRTSEDSRMSITYLVLMMAATMIAAIGVLSDSPILIVGAMIVGPDFGPTAATAVGIASRRWGVARTAFATLLIGFLAGIAAAAVLTLALRKTGIFENSDMLAPHPQTAFIYQVGWPSVVVALIAGVVGMVSLTSAKSGALIGVFVSVTTIPAAAAVSVALVFGLSSEAWGSLLQLFVNILAIQVAAGLTLILQRRLMTHRRSELTELGVQ